MDSVVTATDLRTTSPRVSPKAWLVLLSVALTVALLLYSETMGFVWDEGFHLLSAQLILNSRTPYLDYCFPQTPLNAYWNAAWMAVFGQHWQVTHIPATLEVAGSVYLMASWILQRLPALSWRLPVALATALLIGCNPNVVQFGTVAQAYGMGMFCSAAAFRLALPAATRQSPLPAAWSGLFASVAAASTLLTAPVVPVLWIWLWASSKRGNRLLKGAAFFLGCIPPFLPVLLLFWRAPQQTLFNVVTYQALFRRVNWKGATAHDFDVFTSWLASAPALLLLACSVAAVFWLRHDRESDRQTRAEFVLCGLLALSSLLYIATAHPTFERYFIVGMPFWGGFAGLGLYALGVHLAGSHRPRLCASIAAILMLLCITRDLFDDRDSTRWSEYEQIASKIAEVTPANAAMYVDEQVYFLLRRTPPRGLEFSYSHKLNLPKTQAALYHVVSESELNQQVKQGRYATVESCKDERIEQMKLVELFPHQADIGDCSIFWGPVKGK